MRWTRLNSQSGWTHPRHSGSERTRSRFPAVAPALLIWALTTAPLAAVEPNPEKKLSVEVVQGQGVEHDVTKPGESGIALRVADEARKPVVGAVVVLQLPQKGPGGVFSNGTRFQTILTDANGQVAVQGFRHNSLPGEFSIVATVSYRDYQSVTLNIEQKNVTPPPPDERLPVETTKRDSRRLITLVAIIGGAAAGAALGFSGGGGNGGPATPQAPPAGRPPTSVNPGNPNFGPPR